MPEKSVELATKQLDSYDYLSKNISRFINGIYFANLVEIGFFDSFENAKLLILTHIEAIDIKEIFIPLGFKKKNITIIEEEKKVYNEMLNEPFFEGMGDIVNKKLQKFRPNKDTKWDIFYFDFKCQPHIAIYETIMRLLKYHSTSLVATYINFYGAREFDVKEMYKEVKAHRLSKIEEKVEKGDEIIKKGEKQINSIWRTLYNTFGISNEIIEKILVNHDSQEHRKLFEKLNGLCDPSANGMNPMAMIDQLMNIVKYHEKNIELRDKYAENRIKYTELKDVHLKRADFVSEYIAESLKINAHNFMNFKEKMNTSAPRLDFNNNDYETFMENASDIKKEQIKDLINFILIVGNYPFINTLKQYVYYGKKREGKGGRSPFVNTLFVLADAQTLMDKRYNYICNFHKEAENFLRLMIFFKEGLIKRSAIERIIKTTIIAKYQIRYQDVDISPLLTDLDKKAHKRLVKFERLFLHLKDYGILNITEKDYTYQVFGVNDELKSHTKEFSVNDQQILLYDHRILNIIEGIEIILKASKIFRGMRDKYKPDEIYRVSGSQEELDQTTKEFREIISRIGIKQMESIRGMQIALTDEELTIRTHMGEQKVLKDNLTKEEDKKRKKLIQKYAWKYYPQEKSREIALRMNKEYFEKCNTYPQPLFSEYDVRTQLAWVEIRRKEIIAQNYIFQVEKSRMLRIEQDEEIIQKLGQIQGLNCKMCGDRGVEAHYKNKILDFDFLPSHIELNLHDNFNVLCVLCHYILHKHSPKDRYLTIEEAKEYL